MPAKRDTFSQKNLYGIQKKTDILDDVNKIITKKRRKTTYVSK